MRFEAESEENDLVQELERSVNEGLMKVAKAPTVASTAVKLVLAGADLVAGIHGWRHESFRMCKYAWNSQH